MRAELRHVDNDGDLFVAIAHNEGTGPDNRYWSLTGEQYEGRHRVERKMVCCGAMGDVLVGVWPELESIHIMHLSDADSGAPMHARENARYWLGFSTWLNGEPMVPSPRDETDLDVHPATGLTWAPRTLARHLRVSVETAHEIADYVHRDPNHIEALRYQVRALHGMWRAQAAKAREVLTRLTSTD